MALLPTVMTGVSRAVSLTNDIDGTLVATELVSTADGVTT